MPAAGTVVSLLRSSARTGASDKGFFQIRPINDDPGSLLFPFDADQDGSYECQRLLALADIGAGLGKDVSIGDLSMLENAFVRGKARLSDRPGAGGHAGTSVFVPESPFGAVTFDDGSFAIENIPEGLDSAVRAVW
jgi:hypothetical protein